MAMQVIVKMIVVVDFKLKEIIKSCTEFLLTVNPPKCSLCHGGPIGHLWATSDALWGTYGAPLDNI